MHILVVYQYFQSPDAPGTGRHYSFVRSWANRHRVTVVSAQSTYSTPISQQFAPAPPGVHLESFPIEYANRMGVGRRLLAFQRFAGQATRYGKKIDRPDIVFGTSTPLTVAMAARKIARHWRVPWVFEVRDLWPDFPIEMGAIPGNWLQQRLRKLEYGLYRDADHIITLSPDMEEHVVRLTRSPQKVTTFLNGTSFELLDALPGPDPNELRQRHGLGNRRIVLYAGALGRANGIPVILEAARRLRTDGDIVFVFVGSGYYRDDVAHSAAHEPNVVALPPVPKHEAFGWHQLADLSLVTFIDKPVLATNSPSKFFDSLASGTPVLVTNSGWTRRFVEDHDCGWSISTLNADLLASAIVSIVNQPKALEEKGRNGSRAARTLFDRQVMADEIESTLIRLAVG